MSVAIGLLEMDILIPGSRSLKEKRKVLRSIKDRLLGRHNISIAEVGHQELHARTHVAVVTVSVDRASAESRLNSVLRLVQEQSGAEVIEHQIQWL